MKKIFYFVLFIFLSILGVTLTIQNPQDVLIHYYLGFTWRGPLIIVISTSLAIGIVIGSLAGLVKSLRLKRKYSRLEKINNAASERKNHPTVVLNTKT